jgi:eukaryotic-like serine/threonine-protein kinase
MDFEVGQLLNGKYRIVRRIGVGGMGSVYEALHSGLGTPVAIKVLLPQLARVATVADRFRREAQVSATLKSPHVIQVTDVDQLPDGRPYLVMELLRGQSLQQRLAERKTLSREQAVDIGLQILLGLECAHALGVVHRDIKPDNVFLDEQSVGEVAKLLDFGIAKVKASTEFQALTRPGMVMGTPEYMAPEQAFSADQADARSDLYSVGVILYEMLSGALPAEGSLPLEVAHKVVTGQVQPLGELCPGLPQGLINLVERASQPAREARFQSALEMRRALSAFAGQLSSAGQVAATASLGDRSPHEAIRAGTEKVKAVHVIPLPTAEMSQFQGAASALAPAPPRAATPVAAAEAAARPTASAKPAVVRALRPPISRTAEMPQLRARERDLTPTLDEPGARLDAAQRAEQKVPARRRWALVSALVLGALVLSAAGALWILFGVRADPGPPPPMPTPQKGALAPPPTRPAQRP